MPSATKNLRATEIDPNLEPRSTSVFSNQTLPHDLKRTSVRGAAVTGASQACKFALRFGSTAVLARLLTPEDFGLVAMTTVVVGFAGVFKDAGLTSATVQQDQISHQQISMLFWINLTVGCALALLLAILSPFIAQLYREPRLQSLTVALAATFMFSGFTVQHQALLRRLMRFKALAILEIVSLISGIVIAVLMALRGYAYWSLVGLSVGMSAANAVGAWVALRWVPGLPHRNSNVGSLLRFGGDVLSFNVVNYFSRHADSFLIGWFWGPVALGFYDKAYNMLLLPIGQINAPLAAVAIPTLARARADLARFCRYYLNVLQLVASISLPVVVGIALFADEIVFLWLGPGWERCAGLFRLLALAACIGAISNPIGWLLVSLGHTSRYRQMGIFSAAIIVGAFIIGLPRGAEGVAFAYSVATLLLVVPTWAFVLRDTSISLGQIARTLAPPIISCLAAGLAAWCCLRFIPTSPFAWAAPGAGAFCFIALYSYVLLIVFGRRELLLNILKQFRAPSPAH